MASLFFFFGNTSGENIRYYKDYYETGKKKSEGWVKNGVKSGYWKFYHTNGNVAEKGHYENGIRVDYWYFYTPYKVRSKEGHYSRGKKTDWWLYYDKNGRLDYKCQLNTGIKNGYCIQYTNGEIASAIKYNKGKKIKEWRDIKSFKQENKLTDLR
ncbi:hypothetical protein GH721_14775 [Kriegella sp. EG-1]|nr:hypothetical protein [Flavobacteriaceae bacterium EG-1]